MGWGKNLYDLVRIKIKKACNGYYLRWYYNGWHYWFFLPGTYTVVTEGEKYRTIGTRKIAMSTGQVTRAECDALRTIMNTREVYLLTIAGWMNIRIEPSTINVYDHSINGEEFEIVAIIGSKEVSYATGYSPVIDIPVVAPSVSYCELIIGTQIWMCKNYDSNFPNSLLYYNDETNRPELGGLYNWIQVNSPGFCPVGWHVPSRAEWQTLIDYCGGAAVAGGVLKEIGGSHWYAPNTGAVDTYGFGAIGGGRYAVGTTSGYFTDRYEYGYFWTSEMYAPLEAGHYIEFKHDLASVWTTKTMPIFTHMSVRLIKDTPAPTEYSDWFLPSLDTLQEAYNELKLFGVGGLADAFYWSSSEWDATLVNVINFATGATNQFLKNNAAIYTRAVRTFTAAVGAYSLRDLGQAGGYVFYIDGTTYYEMNPTDLSINKVWSNITLILAGTNTAIGTGQANTTAVIGQAGFVDGAAKLCNDLIIHH